MERNYKLKHRLMASMVDNTVGSRTFQPGEILSWDEEELSDPVVFKVGASVTQLLLSRQRHCQAATPTDQTESKSANRTFLDARKTILEEKISLSVSRRRVRPACIAGVLTSRPNLKAR